MEVQLCWYFAKDEEVWNTDSKWGKWSRGDIFWIQFGRQMKNSVKDLVVKKRDVWGVGTDKQRTEKKDGRVWGVLWSQQEAPWFQRWNKLLWGKKICLNIPTYVKWWTWAANKLQRRLIADRAKQQWKSTVSCEEEFIVQELQFHKDPDFFFQRLWQLQSADVVEKNTLSRRYIPLWHGHIFYSNNPMSIKGTRERKSIGDEYNLIQGEKPGSHKNYTKKYAGVLVYRYFKCW